MILNRCCLSRLKDPRDCHTHTHTHAITSIHTHNDDNNTKRKGKKMKKSVAGSFCGSVSALFGFSCRCATRGCFVGFLCSRLQRRGSAGAPLCCLSIWQGQSRRRRPSSSSSSPSHTFGPVCVLMHPQARGREEVIGKLHF